MADWLSKRLEAKVFANDWHATKYTPHHQFVQ